MIIGSHSNSLLDGINRFIPSFQGLNSKNRRDDGLLLWDHTIHRDGGISLSVNIPNHPSIVNNAPSFSIIRGLYDSFSFLAGVFVRAGYSSSLLIEYSIQFNISYDIVVSNQLREAYWDRQSQDGHPIHFSHTLTISPDQWIDSPSALLEMLLHHLWQSFGYMRCDYYDGNTGQFLRDRIDINRVLRYFLSFCGARHIQALPEKKNSRQVARLV